MVRTGIGGGIILYGELYRGAHGTWSPGDHCIWPLCHGKAFGCWERLGSGSEMSSLDARAAACCHRAYGSADLCTCRARRPTGAAFRGKGGVISGAWLGQPYCSVRPRHHCPGRRCDEEPPPLSQSSAGNNPRSVHSGARRKGPITLGSLGADTGLAGTAQAWLCRCQ
jgi:hypothetical protein